ncbi:MAG TPA: hypothetical protein VJ722_04810 [Rhodanobacteraceae bacterium]|nr:hypothetical protein [Rhodanobacteraceae bacterium]
MKTTPCWLFALVATVSGTAYAAQPAATTIGAPARPGTTLRLPSPVSDKLLSDTRGGFQLGDGLVASFGISRMVYIDGNLVASTRISIPDLSHVDAAQADALAALVGGVTLIRNGPGNFVDPAAFNHAMGAIVIQNTLNNQQIQAVTTIDATVRNLNQFNSMNLATGLQQALINSRGQ